MKLSDRSIGVIAAFSGAAVVVGSFGFHEVPGQQFGSGFFPRIIGVVLILLGAGMTATGSKDQKHFTPAPWMTPHNALKAGAVTAAAVGWVLFAPYFGFIAATALMIAVLAFIAGGRVWISVAVAAGVSIVLHVIFAVLLRVPLPPGAVERLFY